MQERRLLLAIVLSMVVVFTWQVLFPPPAPRPRPASAPSQDTATPLAAPLDSSPAPSMPQSAQNLESLEDSPAIREDPERPPRSLSLDRGRYRLVLDEAGGVVRRLELAPYSTRRADGQHHPTLVVSGDTERIGHLATTLDVPDRAGLAARTWTLETGAAPSGATVRFQVSPRVPELPPGIVLEKQLTFSDTYGAELEIGIRNTSGRRVSLSTAHLEYPLQGIRREGSLLLHLGPGLGDNHPAPIFAEQYLVTGSYGKAGQREAATVERSWTHSIFGTPDATTEVEWAALENRYFALAARPEGFAVDALFLLDESRRTHLWVLLPAVEIEDGMTKSFRLKLFSGPKSTALLRAFAPEFEQLDGMEPTVLPRKVSIARMMVGMLAWIEGYLKNWGWAIIVLTVLVRLLLFPLTHVQFKSMARMQKLKPRIDELQVRYANDKERLQRELLTVYREAGVNPLGGCLPLLVQMPILIGLFIALQNAIELRGVPFVLWIHDLSIPDTVASILGIPLNPLPLFMGVTMWYQQKLTPMPSADPAQQQVMMMMPILMTVLFYNFPSGLALYWSVQNVLSIAQQYYMMRVREVTTT